MSGVEEAVSRLAPISSDDPRLGPRTTYRVGGAASAVVVPESRDDLDLLGSVISETGAPVLMVGKGSNLLVADSGFCGVAVVLGDHFARIRIDETAIGAGAATALPVLARRSAAAGLSGLEWAVGVPGSVGGAVRMNAGGHGSDVAATLRQAEILDLGSGRRRTVPAGALQLGYRTSAIENHHLVVSAVFDLEPGDRSGSEAQIAEIVRWRREHQPGGTNAGSVFRNPPNDSAGRLIDAAGCGGLRRGSAEVSTKHANFIQVDDGGSAHDVVELMEAVAARVLESSGVVLEVETVLVGFDGEVEP